MPNKSKKGDNQCLTKQPSQHRALVVQEPFPPMAAILT
jgi:hypothetical protein